MKRVSVFGRGRVCDAAACGTILSAYNPSSCCAIHERPDDADRSRGGRQGEPSEAYVCANPRCRRVFKSPHQKRSYCSDNCRLDAFRQRELSAKDVDVQT
jgi:hypothetical protein